MTKTKLSLLFVDCLSKKHLHVSTYRFIGDTQLPHTNKAALGINNSCNTPSCKVLATCKATVGLRARTHAPLKPTKTYFPPHIYFFQRIFKGICSASLCNQLVISQHASLWVPYAWILTFLRVIFNKTWRYSGASVAEPRSSSGTIAKEKTQNTKSGPDKNRTITGFNTKRLRSVSVTHWGITVINTQQPHLQDEMTLWGNCVLSTTPPTVSV